MIEVRQTTVFRKWLDDLTDSRATERIARSESYGCKPDCWAM
jgi:putative component of toxin-antitoxin plasmid stabilization module